MRGLRGALRLPQRDAPDCRRLFFCRKPQRAFESAECVGIAFAQKEKKSNAENPNDSAKYCTLRSSSAETELVGWFS